MNRWLTNVAAYIPYALAVVLVTIFFFPELFQGRTFIYRDSGTFYYPLYRHVQEAYYDQGRLPLWNPNENMGVPLAAAGTAAAFYPGKLVFFLTWILPISYESCLRLYVIGHFIFCFAATMLLLRHWRFSSMASFIAALSGVFGGIILTQYCNVVFLVGAAWLPMAVLAGDYVLRQPTLRAMTLFSATLAMMVLGGDPQSVCFAGGILLALAFVYRRPAAKVSTRKKRTSPQEKKLFRRLAASPAAMLFYSACFAVILAGIQFLPTSEFARHSERNWMTPQSIWDIPRYLMNRHSRKMITLVNQDAVNSRMPMDEVLNGLFCRTFHEGGQAQVVYDNSLPPWQLLEFFNPRARGQNAPENHRWVIHLRHDFNWFLSVYMGLVPIVLVLVSFRLRRGVAGIPSKQITTTCIPKHRQLQLVASWILLFSVVAAFGAFAPGWFIHLCLGDSPEASRVSFNDGDPLGGLYWLCNVFIPKFSSFRYPAKMLTPACWAMTVLIAIGWDCMRRYRSVIQIVWVILLINAFVAVMLLAFGWNMSSATSTISSAGGIGYNAKMVWWAVLFGCFHMVIIASIFLLLNTWRHRVYARRKALNSQNVSRRFVCSTRYSCLVALLVVCDLFVANRVMVVSMPDARFHEENQWVNIMREHVPERVEPVRYFSFFWYPKIPIPHELPTNLYRVVTTDRLESLLRWQRQSLSEKMCYEFGMNNVDVLGTMTPLEYFLLGDWLTFRKFSTDPIRVLSFLGTDFFIYPEELVVSHGSRHSFTINPEEATMIASNKRDPETSVTEAAKGAFDCALWKSAIPSTRLRIYHEPPWLARPDMSIFQLLEGGFRGDPEKGEFARFVKYSPNEVEIAVRLSREAAVLIAEQYFPGWRAKVYTQGEGSGRRVDVDRAIGFMRSITLPAGEHLVVMSYCPTSFITGLILSVIGWSCFLFVLLHPWGKTSFIRKPV